MTHLDGSIDLGESDAMSAEDAIVADASPVPDASPDASVDAALDADIDAAADADVDADVDAGIDASVDAGPPVTIGFAVATNANSNDLTLIDWTTNSASRLACSEETSCREPRNPAFNVAGTLVAVPFRHSNSVMLVDTATRAFVGTLADPSLDEPYALAFTVSGDELWVANKSSSTVTIFDVSSRMFVASIADDTIDSPEHIAFVGDEAYVVNRGDGTVSVFDRTTRSRLAHITVGEEPRYIVAHPSSAFAYVSDGRNNVVKINTLDHSVVTSIALPGNPRNMAISPDGSKLYVAVQNDSLQVVDTAADTVSSIVFTSESGLSLYGVGVLGDGSVGFVTDESADVVRVFDLATSTVLTTAPYPFMAGNTPRGIAAR